MTRKSLILTRKLFVSLMTPLSMYTKQLIFVSKYEPAATINFDVCQANDISKLTFLYKLVDIFILFLQMISITLIIQQTQRILKRIILLKNKIHPKLRSNNITNRDSRQRPLATCFGIFDVASERPNIKLFRRVVRTLIASILSDIITKFSKQNLHN